MYLVEILGMPVMKTHLLEMFVAWFFKMLLLLRGHFDLASLYVHFYVVGGSVCLLSAQLHLYTQNHNFYECCCIYKNCERIKSYFWLEHGLWIATDSLCDSGQAMSSLCSSSLFFFRSWSFSMVYLFSISWKETYRFLVIVLQYSNKLIYTIHK